MSHLDRPTESGLRRTMRATALLFGLFAGKHHARAATCDVNYTGPQNGAWNAQANWDTNALPTSAQNVCIPSGKGTITIANGEVAAGLTVTALSALQIDDGGHLALFDATAGFNSSLTGLSVAGTGVINTIGGGVALTGTILANGFVQCRIRLDSGVLSGSGNISGAFTNVAGTVRPGGAGGTGTLLLGGPFVQQAGGTLELDLASDVTYDKLTGPSSDHTIAGSIVVSTIGGFTPTGGTDFFFFTQNANSVAVTASVMPSTYVLTVLLHGAKLTFSPTTTSIASTSTTITTTSTSLATTSTTSTTTSSSTTTSAPPTTVTTSTSTTSTTQAPPATTTTTIPSTCDGPRAATFTSIDCRLDALIADVTAASDVPAKLQKVLLKQLVAARDKKVEAEQLAATEVTRKVLGRLKGSRRKAIGFAHRIRALNSRHQVPMDTIDRLGGSGDEIAADLKTLRGLCTKSSAPECGAP